MRAPPIHPPVLDRWLAASRTAGVDAAITQLHREIAQRVRDAAPVCTASARCCDFRATGHDLFVTGLEVAWTLDRIPDQRAIDAGAIERAAERGDCPFLVRRHGLAACGVHPARPAGCRVYFCDRTRERFVQDLAEHAASAVRGLHDRFGVPYVYAEWRHLLGAFIQQGIAVRPSRPVQAPADPVGAIVELTISREAGA